MLRRFVALLVGGSGAWAVAAGCTASGSNQTLHGPAYELDAGVEMDAAAADAPEPLDTSAPGDAAKTTPPVDATPGDPTDGSDASATDASAAKDDANDDANDDAGCTSSTAILGGNDFSLFAATAIGTGAFTSQTPSGTTTTAPAIVAFAGGFQGLLTGAGDAGGGNALFGIGFAGGAWSAPIALGGNADAIGAPSIAVVGTMLKGVYLNPGYLYFDATFTSGWDTGADPVRPPNDAGAQAFGPMPAAAAGTSTELVIAYEGSNLLPYVQTWTSGVGWDDGVALGSAALLADTSMAIVALDGGGSDLLAVYVDGEGAGSPNNEHLFFVVRSASSATWSSPAMVSTNAFTPAAPTLTSMSGGGALLAWQGGDGAGYESVYTPGSAVAWSTPAQLTAAQVASAPSLAPGVCGDDAVAAYLSSGLVYTTHFAGGAWTAPAALPAGSGATAVSIATAP
jgi:hypothetical protein